MLTKDEPEPSNKFLKRISRSGRAQDLSIFLKLIKVNFSFLVNAPSRDLLGFVRFFFGIPRPATLI